MGAAMRLLLDSSGMNRLHPTTQDRDKKRFYYCAKSPLLAIVRVDGTDLFGAIGVVDAQIGWDNGTPGFAREANEGKRHTKITVRRVLPGIAYQDTLSNVLRKAPMEN